jgi:DNA-binding NarL/FixJ family response regulator
MHTPGRRSVRQPADPSEAIASAQASRPDLILMDIQLPILDSYEATRRLSIGYAVRKVCARHPKKPDAATHRRLLQRVLAVRKRNLIWS